MRALLGLMVIGILGCESSVQDARPGRLGQLGSTDQSIVVPAEAEGGKPFEVLVNTSGGCAANAGEVIWFEGRTAHIEVYDVDLSGVPCFHGGQTIEHRVKIQFNMPGQAEVVIHGMTGQELSQVSRIVSIT